MNTENRISKEPHKFVINITKLGLKSLNKQVALQNFSICCTWKNIRKLYKNNKLSLE